MTKFSELSHSLNNGEALGEADIQRISQTELMVSVLGDDPMNMITNYVAEVKVVENISLEDDSKLIVTKNNHVFHSFSIVNI